MACVFLLLVIAAMAASRAAPVFPGYILSAQYRCDDFECPDWELDLSRVDPSFRLKNLTERFDTLVPKSPIASMNFPVFSAYHEASRVYTVLAVQEQGTGIFWGMRIANDVTSSQRVYTTKFHFPEQNGGVVGLHSLSNGSLVVIFEAGLAAVADTKTGTLTTLANLLPAAKYSNGKVQSATTLNANDDTLYAIIADEYRDNLALSSFNVHTRAANATLLTFKQHDRLGPETIVHMVWVTSKNALCVFMAGSELGFDQIFYLDPATAQGDIIFFNLMDKMIGFSCDENTKSCDFLQTSAYDALQDRVYFQATQYDGDDDTIGTTTLYYVDLSHREPYIDVGLSPFTFGFMDFQFVQVAS